MVHARIKRLINNASALVALQLISYVMPLLLIPYLTRTLGINLYGVVAFGLAIVQIGYLITDFGFNLSATYQIAKKENNKQKVRTIIGAVFMCKLFLLFIVLVLLLALTNINSKYSAYKDYFYLLFIPIAGQALQPIWFFQGIERMGLITLYTLTTRCSFLVLTILLVKNSDDYIWVAISLGVGQVAAALLGIFSMFRLGYYPKWPAFRYARMVLLNSARFFWARAAVSTYTTGAVLFLGLVATPIQVAYYSAAETLYRGAQSIFQPISQALYPYITKTRDIQLHRKIVIAAVLVTFIGAIIGIVWGRELIAVVYGYGFEDGYSVLVIFMFTLLITVPSIFLGYPLLAAMGDSRSANVSVFYGGTAQVMLLALIYILGWRNGASVALSVLIAELLVLLYRLRKSYQLTALHNTK